jgi:hypothetical protein
MRISFVFAQVIGSDDYVLGAATAKLIYRRAKRSYIRFLCRSLREKLLSLFESISAYLRNALRVPVPLFQYSSTRKSAMKLMIESSHKFLFKISIQEARLKNQRIAIVLDNWAKIRGKSQLTPSLVIAFRS